MEPNRNADVGEPTTSGPRQDEQIVVIVRPAHRRPIEIVPQPMITSVTAEHDEPNGDARRGEAMRNNCRTRVIMNLLPVLVAH